jgi:SAM-dependent methyltransferase
MVWTDLERHVAGYYAATLREHGPSPRGVDWNSEESELLRFDQLMQVVPRDAGTSVIDFGCGYGAFARYLEETGTEVAYTGYDVSEDMVASARELARDHPQWSFTSTRETLQPADVVVASGIFNVRMGIDVGHWRDYTLETIRVLAGLSRRAVAFNMLTSYSDRERMVDRLYYGDPCFYFDWCKRNLARNVALLHDYGLYEFTILVRHDD